MKPPHAQPSRGPTRKPRLVLGILGGLGPHAHILLERYLLEAAHRWAGAVREQDLPSWILSSIPETPDRTAALATGGPDILPLLTESLRRVETAYDAQGKRIRGADLILIACNTAHAFLAKLQEKTSLPILDMIEACGAEIARQVPAGTRVGLLATTGTLGSGLYHHALRRRGLAPLSPLDARDGESLQEELVMEPVYGRLGLYDGLKTRGAFAPGTGPDLPRERLEGACRLLRDELACEVLVAACTEIPLALPGNRVAELPLVDPMRILARDAVLLAYGLDPQLSSDS